MARFTLRLDDALFDWALDQSRRGGITPSAFIRDVLQRAQGADPGEFHDRLDEIHATGIQTLAILATSIGKRTPETLEEGLREARRLLRERGLLDPEQDQA
ncbi:MULTISPECIES: hypothetical protein [unclassified Sphingomonas]|uniref:hypothetical protein n=1 Tax=unclassified Sphingomonas TaxID=196159 RepID=UPI0022B330D4|nr:hypothetical protein [Sphingomonas sp. NIBR02145]WHU04268.1 hypothetical protein O3305_06690 [Sphingomonas sp. NIBR02145]